ncbi:MAG: TonB-dependent receptor [Bacteroidota bacterium]
MKTTTHLLNLLLILVAGFLQAQTFTISGYIEDESSGEKLIAANVYDAQSLSGASTNTYGFYSLTLPADSVELVFSYIGYQAIRQKFKLSKDTTIHIQLSSTVALETVEVNAEKLDRIEQRTQMSQTTVPIKQIKKIPALLGEVDVLKTLQLLPGVQAGSEGQNGMYVRGGSPDQNLILLDGVPVYNVSHVLGIFSVFNADAIKNVTLTKGGFPARYGGRLSSVVEINMKEGNLRKWQGEGSVGLISSKLTLEGPIKKDKTSILISGRRTYLDLIFRPIVKSASERSGNGVVTPKIYFYDLNTKIQHKINDKHRLFLSAYSGADVLNIGFEAESDVFIGGTDWDNRIAALRWNWQINNRLFANTTMTCSRYNFDVESSYEDRSSEPVDKFSSIYRSGIEDWAAKVDFDFIPMPNHYIRFGASATHHTYRPGALTLDLSGSIEDIDTTLGNESVRAMEYALYVEDDWQIGAFKANIGLHASAFNVDNTFYTSLQPRIGMRYLLANDWSLKASFSTMTQFINLLTSEALSLPADLWVPSTARIKPQQSWQVAAGTAKTLWDQYEFSIESFYKQMKNVVSYKEGSSFLLDLGNNWEDKITQGDGEAYGAEFFLQKKKGKTTGWIGYTLSWNWRQFDEINGGRHFPFRYDRRHDLSVVLSHQFNERISASMAWVYGTGNAFTLPSYRFQTNAPETSGGGIRTFDTQVTGAKNTARMTNYHRLDLSIELFKQKKRYERRWIFGLYNAYSHVNPYFVIVENFSRSVREIGILPIIPSISYAIKF